MYRLCNISDLLAVLAINWAQGGGCGKLWFTARDMGNNLDWQLAFWVGGGHWLQSAVSRSEAQVTGLVSASETCVWERRESFLNNCRKKISKSRYDIKNGIQFCWYAILWYVPLSGPLWLRTISKKLQPLPASNGNKIRTLDLHCLVSIRQAWVCPTLAMWHAWIETYSTYKRRVGLQKEDRTFHS